jgi:hypothetical protein
VFKLLVEHVLLFMGEADDEEEDEEEEDEDDDEEEYADKVGDGISSVLCFAFALLLSRSSVGFKFCLLTNELFFSSRMLFNAF